MEKRARSQDVDLDDVQKSAIEMALKNDVCYISGGPGTGKTRTVRALVARLIYEGYMVSLLAPTSKACTMITRAMKSSKLKAHTIDKIRQDAARIRKHVLDTVLIIDEMSMMGVSNHFHKLLFELCTGKDIRLEKLILIGDVNQLDPVKDWSLCREILKLKWIPGTVFTKTYRQKDPTKALFQNIKLLSDTKTFSFDVTQLASDDTFVYKPVQNSAQYIPTVLSIFEGCTVYDSSVQVICMSNKIRASLNKSLQNHFNGKSDRIFKTGDVRVGDPVKCTENLYDKEKLVVYNGAMGMVRQKSSGACIEYYNVFDDGTFEIMFQDFWPFRTRFEVHYAGTVHSMQGDQFDQVVYVMDVAEYPMCRRPLPFVALSRAQSRCVVIGVPRDFPRATQIPVYPDTELSEQLALIDPRTVDAQLPQNKRTESNEYISSDDDD